MALMESGGDARGGLDLVSSLAHRRCLDVRYSCFLQILEWTHEYL